MALQDLVLHQKHGHPNSCFSERGHSRQVCVCVGGGNNINKIKNLPEHAGKPSKPSALGQSLRDPPRATSTRCPCRQGHSRFLLYETILSCLWGRIHGVKLPDLGLFNIPAKST